MCFELFFEIFFVPVKEMRVWILTTKAYSPRLKTTRNTPLNAARTHICVPICQRASFVPFSPRPPRGRECATQLPGGGGRGGEIDRHSILCRMLKDERIFGLSFLDFGRSVKKANKWENLKMRFLGLHLLIIGLVYQNTRANVNLSKRTRVVTKGESPCISSEIGKLTYLAGVTKPIEVEISLKINVEEVSQY